MDLFKLMGTIKVDNSEANKALDETSGAGEDAESRLSSSFSKIGSAAINVGKTIAAGMAVAGAAVAGLVTKSIQSYADYEQLVGGVDTLFKDSSEKVQEYAENAYKTAGLSANEYMETVTSFSASLLQSLDGDTAEAANKADMAITDMSDNANKMGTSMESIQNAYQGFAKQNYTMLDNLKLGYGGTKEEMERLLEDAEAISGIEYDISSYADVVDAIHVIQTEMGITGTTAKEASSTITGSISSMKSSWQNLLTAISSEDLPVDEYISKFVDSVSTVADNLLPRIEIALDGVVQLIDTLAPKIIEKIPQLVSTLLPSIIEAASGLLGAFADIIPGIVSAISESAPAFIEGITTIFDDIVSMLPELIDAIVSALPDLIPALIDGIVSMIISVVSNIDDIILPIIDAIPDIIASIVSALISALPDLIAGVGDLVIGLVRALPSILASLVEGIWSIFTGIWDGIKNIFDGTAVGDFFKNTFSKAKDLVQNAWSGVKGFFGKCWDGIKGAFSKTKEWFGDKFSKAKETVQNTWSNVKGFFGNVWSGIKGVFSKTGSWFKEKFTDAKEKAKNAWSNAKEVFSNVYSKVKGVFSNVGGFFKDKFKAGFSNAKNAWSGAKSAFSNIWSKTKGVFSNVGGFFKDKFSDAWNRVKNVFSNVKSFFLGIWDKIKSAFSAIGTKIGNAISGAVKKGINGMLGMIEGVINGFLRLINGAIDLINLIPGVEIGYVNLVSFTRLAKGGVVDEPTPAIFGEDGAEAVVPLEKNTGWIKKVAEQMHSFTLKSDFSAKSLPIEEISAAFDSGLGGRMGRIEALLEKLAGLLSDAPEFFITAESGQNAQLQALRDILTGIREGQIMVLDDGTLVAKTAPKMNVELGKIAIKKGRGR